ncbi:MAG TPA: TIGR01777 family oxidoreductase [Candidatus Dormibacteraeota bacterium]|nr:TIGR01777 family oxidoreductase [Candidatus Dormibacteraeota bacterium]
MNILIAGSSGMIGTAISARLRASGHTVLSFVRPPMIAGQGQVAWNPETGEMDLEKAAGAQAVINLSGASIAGSRWSETRKALLRSSRIDSTRKLVEALARLGPRPKVLVSASAVGYYGNRGDELLTEESAPGDGFLARLVQEWEKEARRAEEFGIRTVMFRFGIVLTAKGGALAQMLGPFRMGVGGRLGSGRQWMSWISLVDMLRLLEEGVANEGWSGAYNAVAPQPVTNAEFTRTLARALHRPAIFPVPPMALRALFGEMADEMLLASQRVEPRRLREQVYSYSHERLEPALRELLTER